jgi:uncharacterized protein
VSTLLTETGSARAAEVEEDLLARLERRMGRVHARQRIGIEQDHERLQSYRFNLDDSEFLRRLLRGILKITGVYWRACRNAENIQVRHNRVTFSNLPASFDGYTILHISDLHVDASPRAVRRLADMLPGLDYDLCVLTGDFRGETRGGCEGAIEGMALLRPHLKDPVFGVLGNHDSVRMIAALEDMGIRLLLNESVAIDRGGDRIHLAGIDDAHFYRLENFEKAVAAIPHGEFSILLSHTPEVFRQAAHANFDFFLAGHTHGGQICLPGSVPIKLGSKLPRRLGAGAWRHNNMRGYTSVGAGSCMLPVRLNCPPEITLHHLQRSR